MNDGEESGSPVAGDNPGDATRNRRERLIDALGDPVNRQLLAAMDDAPRSVQQLLERVPVPKSTVYSRLHQLRGLGLVAVQRTVITPDGKRTDLFRSLVAEARISVRGPETTLNLKMRNLSEERLRDLMEDLHAEVER
jgi:DNA-binding transcriptional ArsR family regulator